MSAPTYPLRKYAAACTALFGLLLASPTFAATDYWTGASNSTWDTSTDNWSSDAPGQDPIAFTSGDSVIFSAGTVTGASNLTLSSSETTGTLTVDSGETVNISPPSTAVLTLTTANVTVASGASLTSTGLDYSQSSTTFNIAGNFTVGVGVNGSTDFGGVIGTGGAYTVTGGGTLNVAEYNGYLSISGSGTTVNITGSNQNGANSGKLKQPVIGAGDTLNIESSLTQTSSSITLGGTLNIINGNSLTGANGLTGTGTLNGSGAGATLGIGTSNVVTTFSGTITGTLNLNETYASSSGGSFTFSGTSTSTGSITVGSSASYILGSAGSLTFYIGANGVTNSISGAGTATYNGTFIFNTTGANLTAGNSWTITNVTTQSFAGSFAAQGFTDNDGIWTDGNLTFNQSTGILSVSAIPEPAAFGLLGGLAALAAVIGYRRKIRHAAVPAIV